MKVDGSLKSLLQGVSQQPLRDRLAGQCTEQINMSSDPVTGLTRRAPSDLVAELVKNKTVRGIQEFEVANGRQFIAIFTDEDVVNVYDFNGVPIAVTQTGAVAAYIRKAGRLRYAAIENQLVITNNGVIPAMINSTRGFLNAGPNSYPCALVQVRGGTYGRSYKIHVNGGEVANYKPPNGSEAGMVDFTRTSWIAERLFQSLTETGGYQGNIDGAGSSINRLGIIRPANGWNVNRFDDVIYIERPNGPAFTLTVSDDAGGVNIKGVTDQVPLSADLPPKAPNKYVVRVAKETNPEDDLYLEYKLDNGVTTPGAGFGQAGYWQETVSPWVNYQINKTTMPIILEYNNNSTFTLREGNWKDRLIGTDNNNPMPSFIGVPIQDVTTFQSRLVMLTGSYVCMSRTNRNEDFWMSTASGIIESDPIDISSTAVQASTMYAAIPHNRDLVIFSNQGQFVIYGKSSISPQNATLTLTTAFEAELGAKPVPSGRNVFFATNYGRYTGIREFFTEGGTDINDTRPVTQHVKQYLKGKVQRLAATSNYDMLAVTTDSSDKELYIYQYIWNDVDKIQSAWSKWTFPDPVEHFFFSEELMYLILNRDGAYYLVRLSLDITDVEGVGYPIQLDNRFDVSNVNKKFYLPKPLKATDPLVFVQGLDCPDPGMRVPHDSIIDNGTQLEVTLRYDMQGGRIVGGTSYKSLYRPSMPLIKDAAGVVQSSGKLRVKHFIVALSDTGDINGQMLSDYGNSDVVKFQARIIGNVNNRVGVPALTNEAFVMPFREQTDKADIVLWTESHLPMTLLDIEWQGQYTKRGRRMVEGGK